MQRTPRFVAVAVVAVVAGTLALSASAVTATAPADDGTVYTVSEGESIQAAVDDAEPGDTVRIEAGTYREHVEFDVRNLTVVGAGDAVVDGFRQNETVVNVTADDVRLANLTVTGGVGEGRVDEENRTRTPVGIGIRVDDADGVELVDLRVAENDGWGVYVRDSADTLVARNELVDNVWDGVIVVNGENAVVRDNNASGNGRTDYYWHQRHGIRFTGTTDGIIANNTATGNAYAGVLFTGESTNNTVRGNLMRGNRKRGFGTFGPARDNTVVDNRIVANGEYGIISYGPGGDNRYVNNTVRANDGHGVLLDSTGGDEVRGNRIVDNDWIGVTVADASEYVVADNAVVDNGGIGVDVLGGSATHVADNRVSGSSVGLRVLRRSEGLAVVDNRFADLRYGIGVNENATGSVTVGYNDVVDAEAYGLAVFRGYYSGFDDGAFTDVVTEELDVPPVDARRNHWGAASGPRTPSNPDGTGANVTANVLVDPWTDGSVDAPPNWPSEPDDAETPTATPEATASPTATPEPTPTATSEPSPTPTATATSSSDAETATAEPTATAGTPTDRPQTSTSVPLTSTTTAETDAVGDDESTEDPGRTTASGSGPGFDLLAAVWAIVTLGVVARRRL